MTKKFENMESLVLENRRKGIRSSIFGGENPMVSEEVEFAELDPVRIPARFPSRPRSLIGPAPSPPVEPVKAEDPSVAVDPPVAAYPPVAGYAPIAVDSKPTNVPKFKGIRSDALPTLSPFPTFQFDFVGPGEARVAVVPRTHARLPVVGKVQMKTGLDFQELRSQIANHAAVIPDRRKNLGFAESVFSDEKLGPIPERIHIVREGNDTSDIYYAERSGE
jgi:hypothetical protein